MRLCFNKYFYFSFFRWIDQFLLGFLAGLIVVLIDKLNLFSPLSLIANGAWYDVVIIIVVFSAVAYAFQLKLWLPKLNHTFYSMVKWPPIYLAIVVGISTYVFFHPHENKYDLLENLLLLSISALIISELFLRAKDKCKTRGYKHPDAPVENILLDKLNRKNLVDNLIKYWVSRIPKSGFILGGFGVGKTSLVKMAAKECEKKFKDKILVIPVSSWGHSEGDIIAYIIDHIIEELSRVCDVSSLVGFGKNYSISLSGGDGFFERMRFMFPSIDKFEHFDKLLRLLGIHVILVIEDMDREFPFPERLIEWDMIERQKLSQISKLGEDCLKSKHIAVWFTVSPNALSMLPSIFKRIAPNKINLNDFSVRMQNANLITNFMTSTGETI